MQNAVERITNANANNDQDHIMGSQGVSLNCLLATEMLLYICDHSVGNMLWANYSGI